MKKHNYTIILGWSLGLVMKMLVVGTCNTLSGCLGLRPNSASCSSFLLTEAEVMAQVFVPLMITWKLDAVCGSQLVPGTAQTLLRT